jgi:hypothetical protein
MQGRVGTCLEDDVAFGVKDESAHIGDDCAATVDDAGHRLDAHVPVVHGDVVTGNAVPQATARKTWSSGQ